MRPGYLDAGRVRFLIRAAQWRKGVAWAPQVGAVFDFKGGECIRIRLGDVRA